MNLDNLHELINRYEQNIDILYGEEHDELFKWRAVKTWQEEWNKPTESFSNFSERFAAAVRDCSIFMDNSRMHPTNGIFKLWEIAPNEVEKLFTETLFADVGTNPSLIQNNMEAFLKKHDELLKKHFPKSWSFQQDRHSASVFLAMNSPEINYVYKSTEARTMAKYIDYGFAIGTGENFNLPNYYRMCEEIVVALKEHPSLLEKHFSMLTDDMYRDESLHMLAFDLIRCSSAYHFYRGLTFSSTGKTIRKKKEEGPSAEELAKREEERLAEIASLEEKIAELEPQLHEIEEISLLGVEVTTKQYGTGIVIGQKENRVTIRFGDEEKKFTLDKKFSARPQFEDDEKIIEIFTQYGRVSEEIKKYQDQIRRLSR